MTIAFVGWASFDVLQRQIPFEPPLPSVAWGFPLGAALVLGLVKRGHHVHVIVTDHQFVEHKVYAAAGCTVHVLPEWETKWMYLTFFRHEVSAMVRLILSIKPDVVFAQWTYQNARAAIISGLPNLIVAHDSSWRIVGVTRSIQPLIRAVYAQFFVFPRIDNLTTVSPYMVRELRKFNHYWREVRVIPNGINVHQNYGEVRKDAKVIVCISQWDRRKNLKMLVRAFEDLYRNHKDWRLVVYGQGTVAGIMGESPKNRVCLNGVELRGMAKKEEVDRVLREEADVFCSPTLEESFGMVFVEAMAHGVPCVGGTNSGAVPWVIGGGGVTCDVTKPKPLAACLERVMLDYDLRRKLSAQGIKQVRERFDIEKVVDLYEHELVRVAQEGR